MRNKTTSFFDYEVFSDQGFKLYPDKKILINTINQYSFCMAERDPEYKKALMESDILLPDGVAITASIRLLSRKKVKKIAGADIHEALLRTLNSKRGKVFYLGASPTTLSLIQARLKKEYPSIQVAYYSPPFKTSFSEEDSEMMLKMVNAFQPDVLFIGMTAPKQEKWAFEHLELINAHVICSIGAVFDFYAGKVNRPGPVWIKLGLEWLGRLVKEPKRLWKRYLYYGPIFIFSIVKEKLKVKRKILSNNLIQKEQGIY